MSGSVNNLDAEVLLERRCGQHWACSHECDQWIARKNLRALASRSWRNSQVNRADSVMRESVLEVTLPQKRDKVAQLIDSLVQNDYHFERDVSQQREALQEFRGEHASNGWYRPLYRKALQRVAAMTKPRTSLKFYELQTLPEYRAVMSKPSASTGIFSVYTNVKKKGDLTETEFVQMSRNASELVRSGAPGDPAELVTRLQLSIPVDEEGNLSLTDGRLEYKSKSRVAQCVSIVNNYIEMHMSVPAQKYMAGLRWYEGGKTRAELRELLGRWRMHYTDWCSVDYHHYDAHLPGWFITDVFKHVVRPWFGKLSDEQEATFNWMVDDFVNHSMLMEDGSIEVFHNGVPSGSQWTNMIDSLCNLVMLEYFAELKGKTYGRDYHCQICGDDNLIFHKGWFVLDDYAHFLDKVFGVPMSVDKCSYGLRIQDPEYLSTTWTQYGEWRSPWELIVKLVWHEHGRSYGDQPGEVTPWQVITAFYQMWPRGMSEWCDLGKLRRVSGCYGLDGLLTKEAAQAVGGIVAYESMYGPKQMA